VILTREDVSQCHYVHHRFYVGWRGMDMESPQRKSGNLPPEQTMKNVSITCLLTLHSSKVCHPRCVCNSLGGRRIVNTTQLISCVVLTILLPPNGLHSSLTELYRSARFDACSFKYFILVPLKVGYVYDITLILFEPFNAGIKSLCVTAAC